MTPKAFSDQIRARIRGLIAETGNGDVIVHYVTAMNEAIGQGIQVTGEMLMAMPLYRAVPGHEHRVVRSVELVDRVENKIVYLGIHWEPE